MANDAAGFKLEIDRFIKSVGAKADIVAKKIVFDLGKEIILTSPVGNTKLWKTKYPPKGYVGGRFRGNWQFAPDSPPSGETGAVDPSGQATLTTLQATVDSGMKFGITGYLANNVPYATSLEFGHSTQAPNGMVRIAVLRWQAFVDSAAAQVNQQAAE